MARNRVGLETEARILAATRKLLGELGLEGTTLTGICDEAGVGASSFYNIFSSKEEVVLRVVVEAIAAVDPDPAGAGTDTVADLVDAYIRFITDEPLVARIYLRLAAGGGGSDAHQRVLRHHLRRVERFAAAASRQTPGLDPGEATDRAEQLLATLDGLALRWLLDPAFDFARHARRVLPTADQRA